MVTWLLSNVLLVAGLIALAALVGRIGRSRPAFCHALWLLVLVKLLVPPGVFEPWRLPVVLPPLAKEVSAVDAVNTVNTGTRMGGRPLEITTDARLRKTAPPRAGIREPVSADASSRSAGFALPAPSLGPVVSATASSPPANPPGPPTDYLHLAIALLWVGGALVAVGAEAFRIRRFRRLLLAAEPAPVELKRRVEAIAARLGVRPPRTTVVDGVLSPILWCFGRPCLVWPAALFKALPPDAWSDVIAHELAHLKRRDHWVGWLVLVGGLVWWWNPLFWIVRRRLHHWAELACDAWVVWVRPQGCRRYARTLIEVSRFVSRAARPLPAMGMSAAAFHELERRLNMILNHRPGRRVPVVGLFLLAVAGLFVAPGLTFSQETPKKPAKKTAVVEEIIEEVVEISESRPRAEPVEEPVAVTETCPDPVRGNRRRAFGPGQATGAPDTLGHGHRPTAWTPRTPDRGAEWLLLHFRTPVRPMAVRIYETNHPGAVSKVSALRGRSEELALWEGRDPTASNRRRGISLIQFEPVDFKTRAIKIYLDTRRVKGRNAIDAVELLGEEGPQFASSARASSSPRVRTNRADSGVAIAAAGVLRGTVPAKSHPGRRGARTTETAPSASFYGRPVARTLEPGRYTVNRQGEVIEYRAAEQAIRRSPPAAKIGRRTGIPTTGHARPPGAPPAAEVAPGRPPGRAVPPGSERRLDKLEREIALLKRMLKRLEKKLGSDV